MLTSDAIYLAQIDWLRIILRCIACVFIVVTLARKRPINAAGLCVIVCAFFAIYISWLEIDLNSWWNDHVVYAYTYLEKGERYAKDPFFTAFTNLMRAIGLPLGAYFGVIALWYVVAYWIACRIMTRGQAQATLFVMIISSAFFVAYGVNTLRAGMAVSTAILTMAVYSRSRLWAAVFALIAINIHFSVALTICAFGLAFVVKNYKFCLVVWCVCLLLSFMVGSSMQEFFADMVSDERAQYLETMMSKHGQFNSAGVALLKKGFRWDFVAYSLLPICVGWYYICRRGFRDGMYMHYYRTYIIANSAWLLVIGAFFTDRFAYLSWCLTPILLILPLCRARIFTHQNYVIAFTLLANLLIGIYI